MAPIPSSPAEVEVRLATRLEIRQTPQPYVITQTITRDFTTYTSTVTLGTLTSFPPPTAPTLTTPAPTIIQTVAPAPAKTTTDNNGVVIGAVLGSFLGLAVLLALVWKCCFDGRSVLWRPGWDDSSSYSGSGSPSLGSSRSSRRRVRRRGGYLDDGVRRPRRAHVRRDRRGSLDGSLDRRSERYWGDEKRRRRRSKVVIRNGMMGWSFGGGWSGGRRRSRDRRRSGDGRRERWVESERVRMRFTTDD